MPMVLVPVFTTSMESFIESPAAGKSPANPTRFGPLINATGEGAGLSCNAV
jgi:hypothetical protein